MNTSSLLLISIVFLILYYLSSHTTENFYLWNIPTRWPRPLYDIRGYPETYSNYYFLHRGYLWNNGYLNMNRYPYLYHYMPYWYNGMIYTADGSYTYDRFFRLYPNIPIMYYPGDAGIDWYGLANSGVINDRRIIAAKQ